MEHLLTIGAFARRCGLSPSALRFYDECGLLRPVAVDDHTGYRYYGTAQVADGDLVRQLRATGFSVDDARLYLSAGTEERDALLEGYERLLADRARAQQEALAALKQELRNGATLPAQRVRLEAARLGRSLGQVGFAAGTDGHRRELCGVLLEVRDDSLRVVATDSYRLAVRDLALGQDHEVGTGLRGLVPLESVEALRSALEAAGTAELRTHEGGGLDIWVEGRVVAHAGESTFPDYEEVLLGQNGCFSALVARDELLTELHNCPGDLMTIEFTKESLLIRSDDGQVAVGTDWAGPSFKMGANPQFLAEALAVMVGPDVLLSAISPLAPITLRSADDGTLSVLTMPVRLNS